MTFETRRFCDIDLDDPFFDSLKADYQEFAPWFKSKGPAHAYVMVDGADALQGFLFLKIETGPVDDIVPQLPARRRLKIGTFKIKAHGTKLGQRFLKKVFDHALDANLDQVYVTVFPKHRPLVALLERYGFKKEATKTTANGTEDVLVKRLDGSGADLLEKYPVVDLSRGRNFLLALYPVWHSRLLPDSILSNEDDALVTDISSTNSIHKVYLGAMDAMADLESGDNLLIYRTTDNKGPARFRAVATSICVVEEYRNLQSFSCEDEFIAYCSPFSVFRTRELREYWRSRRYPHVVRFTYNLALSRRVTRGEMIDHAGLDETKRWGCIPLSEAQMKAIVRLGRREGSHAII